MMKNITNVLSRCKDYILLTLLLAFHAINNHIWLRIDRYPPAWDEAQYLLYSLKYYDVFTLKIPILNFVAINPYRPPLHMLLATPLYGVFGTSYDISVAVNVFFMGILIFSVYGIGKKICNKNVGLLSAFFVSTFPTLFSLSRTFLSDFALTAMVSLSIYFLLLTDNFKNRKYSALFGVALGLGFFTRPTYIIFIIGPLLFVLWKATLLSFSNISHIFRRLKNNWQSCFIVISSGFFVGFFIWMATVINTNNHPAINIFGDFRILSAVGSIVFCFVVWLLTSMTIHSYTKAPLDKILRLDSYSYLSTLFLLLYIKQFYQYTQYYEYYLCLLTLLSFLIAKIYFLRPALRTKCAKRGSTDITWLNFVLSGSIALAIFGWWHILVAPKFVAYWGFHGSEGPLVGPGVDLSVLGVIFYYPYYLLNQQLLSYSYVLIGVIVYFIISRRKKLSLLLQSRYKKKILTKWLYSKSSTDMLILALWILIPLLFFTFAIQKVSRFIIPYLPPLAIIMALCILKIRRMGKKIIVVALVVLLGLTQFFLLSYGTPLLPPNYTIKTPVGELFLFGQEPLEGLAYSYHSHPIQGDWKVEDILNTINSDIEATANKSAYPKVGILIATFKGPVDPCTIRYEACRLRVPVEIISPDGTWPPERYFQEFDSIDYIITLNGSSKHLMLERTKKGYELFVDNIAEFVLIQSYKLPNNMIVEIYRRVENQP